jgi:hypothetical protein
MFRLQPHVAEHVARQKHAIGWPATDPVISIHIRRGAL